MEKLFFLSIILILIVYVVDLCYKEEVHDINYNQNMYIRVKRDKTGKVDVIPFENYIIGVVAGEMPISFDIEALKAQAVASRSYALVKMKQNITNDYDVVDTISNQVYLDNDTLLNSWKDNYNENINKIIDAVTSTSGEYMLYKGEVVNAFFFSTSTGKTENCVEVFGGDLPYLVSVESHWDEDVSPIYQHQKHLKLSDFLDRLGLEYKDNISLEIIDSTSTGRIKKLIINGKEFKGSDIVNMLSLKSSFFNITQKDNDIYITTKGYGHGVGMSQYGALGMALEGYNYKDILKHYYSGVDLAKI